MVRITKLTDYGVMIMAFLAASPKQWFQAREIAEKLAISLPTVAKLLKKLVKSELLLSQRGAQGGYQLKLPAESLTLADLVNALEGPIAITECSLQHSQCKTESSCSVKAPWVRINDIITQALQSVTLADLNKRKIPLEISI